MVKKLFDARLGEEVDVPIAKGVLDEPVRLVAIKFIIQGKDKSQMSVDLKHKDYDENWEED